jgi:hypothetical protein
MEKAHGWEYVRSKNNGKNRENGAPTSNNGLPTPQTENILTPSSDGNIVHIPEDEDFDHMQTRFEGSAWDDNQNHLNFPEYNTSDIDMFAAPSNQQLQLDFSPVSNMNHSGSISSNGQSPYMANTLPGQDQFQDTFQNFNSNNVDISLFENEDLYSANVQLPTPSHEVYQRALNCFDNSGIPFNADPIPHISPVGHGNTMLYTPTSMLDVDEGFEDFVPANCNTQIGNSADFQLFPSSTGGTISSTAPSALFGEIPFTNGFPGVSAQDLLDFYAASTAAATQHHHQNNTGMDWSSDDQFGGYRSH